MKDTPTPEYLNAYVDGELSADERERALALVTSDPEFRLRACELRTIKEMVKGAYAEAPAPPVRAHPRARAGLGGMAVAGLVLALGVGGGWVAHDYVNPGAAQRLGAGLPEGYKAIALSDRVDPDKIILHLDSGDVSRLARVLDLAERILAQRGAGARVEIVANSYGLDLLRADVTPLGPRIVDMSHRHANLSFVACGQTVARLAREGVRVELLKEAGTASSAINEIMTRMGEGWVYVKV